MNSDRLNLMLSIVILLMVVGCSSKGGGAAESSLTIDSSAQSEATYVAAQSELSEGINLVVPIEMIDYGLSSSNSEAVTFSRSAATLNPEDFVAQSNSFSWEINAWNGHPSNSFDVLLVDESDTTIATITLPSAMSATTRYEVTFTPNSGSNVYKIKIPQTDSSNQIRIFSARILITQLMATETKIYIPLTHGQHNSFSSAQWPAVLTTTSTNYISDSQYLAQWERNNSAFAEIQEISMDALLASTSVAGSVELALFDQSETQVDGSELSHSGATITQKITSLTASSNFSDLENYHLSLKATGTGQTASLFKAGLWIKLSNLRRARVYYRLGTAKNTSTSYWSYNYRYLDRSSSYSNPEVNLLIKAATTLNGDGTSLEFWDTTTSDTGITQNVISVSSSLSTTATWQTLGPLTLTPGQRYQLYHRIGSGETSEMHGAFLTIDASN